jgi:ABC-type multidrug transport system fused ATPase/permease subunit
LLAARSDLPEPERPKPCQAAGATVRFDHVDFAYGDKPVLRDINLTIQPGQMVALVGASGSGKTTLTNLLLRFYDPQRGAVRIGDTDIREFATRDLRNQIAVVTQETILFNDTIRRNIELSRPGVTEEEIIAAAKHANAHEFIIEKPQGYDAVVGEKGVALSGGQRQRIAIRLLKKSFSSETTCENPNEFEGQFSKTCLFQQPAIARAIVKNAPILILDEATSALDTESERAVQAALEELMVGCTTICIAHRLSTIQKADTIVVLDQGRIVETGQHTELLRLNGFYARLYNLQFDPRSNATPRFGVP